MGSNYFSILPLAMTLSPKTRFAEPLPEALGGGFYTYTHTKKDDLE